LRKHAVRDWGNGRDLIRDLVGFFRKLLDVSYALHEAEESYTCSIFFLGHWYKTSDIRLTLLRRHCDKSSDTGSTFFEIL
jgi:hypothetical protein